MSLDELMRQRRAKLAQWRALGVEPYAYRFEPTHRAADLLARGDAVTTEPGEQVRLAGRVMTLRAHGKAGFAHLLDGSGRIQLYFRADHLGDGFRRYELLDVGDWIGVAGPLFRTRTGEITVRVDGLELLAKAVRPLPDDWHGLRDPETRFRQRYADLFMNLEVRDVFRRRARLVSTCRSFLDGRGYLEVETPVLQPLYGGAFARPFVTRHHALDMELFLRISNELYLKRLIVGGLERVYEFSRDFRNEGIDRTHSPEFTMLEFYQAFADVHDMMEVTESLLSEAVERVTGGTTVSYQGQPLEFARPWPRVSMLDEVSQRVSERVDDLDPERLRRLAERHGTESRPGEGPGALLDGLFSALVQPSLVRPCFVVDYPIEISPLARSSRTRPAVVERFEVIVAGVELANAFSEQNDPDAQRRAFEHQMARRASGDEEAQVMDHDYLRALEYGMPPAGGVGIGIDRLTMLVTDARSIRDVVLFPQLRPEEGRAEMDGALAEGGEGAGASPPGPATGEPRARAAPRPEPGAR
ncbi:MAG: lysine--tRNA ligase [Candidatus Eisenbacteria bacterium]|uniref:Lysine--tRNA ligase n=1 Tax=Eiseniibacteriota bacterium TaxID=2212470 RepID=A0A538TYG1_UNCEI|nr:MAG: lysine--tRNA ligase [Candidatus Eisenbacteria bacterium]